MRLLNHKERRAYNKAHKTNHTLQDFALMYAVDGIQKGQDISWLKPYLPMDLLAHKDNWELFPDGTKVKLNYDGVMARPLKYLSAEFKAWVEENKEEEFTIFRDPEDKDRKGLLALRYVDETKDTDFSKTLLFDMYSDLLAWSELEKGYVNPQKIEDLVNEIANIKQSLGMCDKLDLEVEEEDYKKIEDIKKSLEDHENGTNVVVDPVVWQNMDSDLQTILEKATTLPEIEEPEENSEAPAEEVVDSNEPNNIEQNESNTTEGGEE